MDQYSLDKKPEIVPKNDPLVNDDISYDVESSLRVHQLEEENSCKDENSLCIFLYGISEASMLQGMKLLKVDDAVEFTDNISEADALLALQSKLKKNSRIQAAARSLGIPVYVTKASSLAQLTKAIQALMTDYEDDLEVFGSEAKVNESEKIDALEEARTAIEQVVIPRGEAMDLLPRPWNIMLLQKDLIRKYKLKSERIGSEPNVHLRVLPFQDANDEDEIKDEKVVADDDELEELFFKPITTEANGSPYSSLDRLPLLPDN